MNWVEWDGMFEQMNGADFFRAQPPKQFWEVCPKLLHHLHNALLAGVVAHVCTDRSSAIR